MPSQSTSGSTTGSGTSFIRIPGNIKQQFLPFVIDPDANLHKTAKASNSDILLKNVSP